MNRPHPTATENEILRIAEEYPGQGIVLNDNGTARPDRRCIITPEMAKAYRAAYAKTSVEVAEGYAPATYNR